MSVLRIAADRPPSQRQNPADTVQAGFRSSVAPVDGRLVTTGVRDAKEPIADSGTGGHHFDRIRVFPSSKLEIAAPDHFREREADRIATATVGDPPVANGPCKTHPRSIDSASITNALQSPGEPLEDSVRSFLEPRFVADFSGVRVHTDRRATESAAAVGAMAYTVGNDIVFGLGQHQPGDNRGLRLLAHELAHVVQPDPAVPTIFRAALTYDPTAFTISLPTQPFTLDDAKQMVEDKKKASPPGLKSGTVKGATAGSTEEIFLWFILAQVSNPDRWGTEADIITAIGWPAAKGAATPIGEVTVDIDSKGNGVAKLISAGPVTAPSTYTKKEDAEQELKSKYGIASVKDDDASWTLPDLNKIIGAFALLPAKDRVALNGVDLVRVAQISGGENCGEFSSSQSVSDTTVTTEATLKIANCAFEHEAESFVGGQATQSPESYLTIVHEVGHAIATKTFRDAATAHMEAIAKSNEAIEASNASIEATNTVIDEFNALVNELNSLNDELKAAKKGKDKDAIQGATDAASNKKKELDAKKKELDSAKKEQASKKAAVTAAKATVEAKKKARESAMAPTATFKATAATKKSDAGAKLKGAQAGAKGFTQKDADDSAAYRTAVEEAAKAIDEYATSAAEEGADLDSLDSTAQGALDSRDSERQSLTTANPSNAALGRFAAVDKAQDGWFDAEKALGHARQRTMRVQKFVDFVNANKITPITQYAKDNWPLKPEEFYAEAYSLWLTDPEYLQANVKVLYNWFQTGKYK